MGVFGIGSKSVPRGEILEVTGDLQDLTGAEAPLPGVALSGISGYITEVGGTRSHDLFPPLWKKFQKIRCFLHALLSRSYA
jgi:hypothetical protein